MSASRSNSQVISVQPLTAARWPDLLELVGERGAYAGCWCMWFRRPNADWWAAGNAGNRAALQAIVDAERVPGLLGYADGHAVGWVSLAPRDEYERISGDHEAAQHGGRDPVWSVVCFFIDRRHRGQGIASALLDAAVNYARQQGAAVLEAYPIEPDTRVDNASAYHGTRQMFERAGFVETGRFDRWKAAPTASGAHALPVRRPPGRPVMRLDLRGRRPSAGQAPAVSPDT